jgi:type I restriction enzyme, S subunit
LVPHLNVADVRNLLLPKPPSLPEQKRIVEILTDRLSTIEQARAATAAQLAAAKALPAAYLRQIFDSPEAQKWKRKKLGELLLTPLKTGISKPENPISDKRCLTLSSIRNGELKFEASKFVNVSDHEAERNWVKPNAFYVVRGNGNPFLVGRGGLAPEQILSPILYPDLLIEVMVNPEIIMPSYLQCIWDSPLIRCDIESKSRTAAGIYKINQANLSSIIVLLPPLNRQREIVDLLK